MSARRPSARRFRAAQGRGRRETLPAGDGALTLIDESYNANPTSMRAALELLGAERPIGRRIAVLGDMLELGPSAAELHADLAGDLEAAGVDLVFTAGPMMARLELRRAGGDARRASRRRRASSRRPCSTRSAPATW